MTKPEITKGTRIYYGGDMANNPGFGTITERKQSAYGDYVEVNYDDGRTTCLPIVAFSPEYKGHGGTRFVTLAAYNEYRRKKCLALGIKDFQEVK